MPKLGHFLLYFLADLHVFRAAKYLFVLACSTSGGERSSRACKIISEEELGPPLASSESSSHKPDMVNKAITHRVVSSSCHHITKHTHTCTHAIALNRVAHDATMRRHELYWRIWWTPSRAEFYSSSLHDPKNTIPIFIYTYVLSSLRFLFVRHFIRFGKSAEVN